MVDIAVPDSGIRGLLFPFFTRDPAVYVDEGLEMDDWFVDFAVVASSAAVDSAKMCSVWLIQKDVYIV